MLNPRSPGKRPPVVRTFVVKTFVVRTFVMRALFLAVFLIAAVAWSGAVLAASHVYRLYVDGLACPFCAYGVEKNILALDGVEKLDIDMAGGFITVVMQTGRALDEETAKRAVGDSGFTLRRFEAPKK